MAARGDQSLIRQDSGYEDHESEEKSQFAGMDLEFIYSFQRGAVGEVEVNTLHQHKRQEVKGKNRMLDKSS